MRCKNIISFSTVKLSPPSNLTMKVGSDSNLWYYWNRTSYICEENQVRYRINNGDWMVSQRRDTVRTSLAWPSPCFSPVLLYRIHQLLSATASTSPPTAPCTSFRSAPRWPATADSPYTGATGASLFCGAATP